MKYTYKLKYIVIVEDANGEFVEQAVGSDHYFDTEDEALEFIKDMNEQICRLSLSEGSVGRFCLVRDKDTILSPKTL